MTAVNDKETSTTPNGRRKFLLRAGLGSLPVLLTLKSKAAWGTSTLNCSLSETASQMQSVQPDKFEQCKYSFNSHGSAKLYFEADKLGAADGKGAYFYKKKSVPLSKWLKEWHSIDIYQDTPFNAVFGSGYSGTLKQAVNQGGDHSLTRNIASAFLHALYYQREQISTNLPSPDDIVNAYIGAVTPAQKAQLAALLSYYIDGYPV